MDCYLRRLKQELVRAAGAEEVLRGEEGTRLAGGGQDLS